jgi:hypothetical protein
MKIVVYNSHDQYALSRKEVELIREVLPNDYWAKIKEFHLAHSHPNTKEAFEYDEDKGIAYFIYPVKEKSAATRKMAVFELLLGLNRIRDKSRFFSPVKEHERNVHKEFIDKWMSVCLAKLVSK